MCCKDARRPRRAPARRNAQSGVGLVDTLVALLLLALSLLGASATLIQTLGANRAAALQTSAVDFAADLVEDLRAGSAAYPDMDTLQDWQTRVAEGLPVGTPPIDQYASAIPTEVMAPTPAPAMNVSLRWWDPSIHRPIALAMQAAGDWPAAP